MLVDGELAGVLAQHALAVLRVGLEGLLAVLLRVLEDRLDLVRLPAEAREVVAVVGAAEAAEAALHEVPELVLVLELVDPAPAAEALAVEAQEVVGVLEVRPLVDHPPAAEPALDELRVLVLVLEAVDPAVLADPLAEELLEVVRVLEVLARVDDAVAAEPALDERLVLVGVLELVDGAPAAQARPVELLQERGILELLPRVDGAVGGPLRRRPALGLLAELVDGERAAGADHLVDGPRHLGVVGLLLAVEAPGVERHVVVRPQVLRPALPLLLAALEHLGDLVPGHLALGRGRRRGRGRSRERRRRRLEAGAEALVEGGAGGKTRREVTAHGVRRRQLLEGHALELPREVRAPGLGELELLRARLAVVGELDALDEIPLVGLLPLRDRGARPRLEERDGGGGLLRHTDFAVHLGQGLLRVPDHVGGARCPGRALGLPHGDAEALLELARVRERPRHLDPRAEVRGRGGRALDLVQRRLELPAQRGAVEA